MGAYPISQKQWAALDTEVLSLAQLMTLEPDDAGVTWPSGMWSTSEVISYLNDVQRDFISSTGITCAISFFFGTPNQTRYDINQTIIDIRRLAWRVGPNGTAYVECARVDNWELDYGTANWEQNTAPGPDMYLTDLVDECQVQVQPAPYDVGEAELTTINLGVTVDGLGTALSVPDDWVPYLLWGVLAKMLSKEGEPSDHERADYCKMRYQEGVDLARLMVEGVS